MLLNKLIKNRYKYNIKNKIQINKVLINNLHLIKFLMKMIIIFKYLINKSIPQ